MVAGMRFKSMAALVWRCVRRCCLDSGCGRCSFDTATIGSHPDFEAMLETVRRHAIVPVVDSITPFEDGLVCFDTMEKSSQFGKLVVSLFTRSRL